MTQEFKPGDRVRVTFEGEYRHDLVNGGHAVKYVSGITDGAWYFRDGEVTIELLPPAAKPLEVGEEVTWGAGIHAYRVLLIEDGEVVLAKRGRETGGGDFVPELFGVGRVRRLDQVVRASGIPISTGGE